MKIKSTAQIIQKIFGCTTLVLIILKLTLSSSGCGGGTGGTTTPCSNTNAKFAPIFNAASGSVFKVNANSATYSFKSSQNGTICALGYRHVGVGTANYQIQILDGSNNILSNGTYACTAGGMAYHNITPQAITANAVYKIRRINVSGIDSITAKQIPATAITSGLINYSSASNPITVINTESVNITAVNGILPEIDFIFN